MRSPPFTYSDLLPGGTSPDRLLADTRGTPPCDDPLAGIFPLLDPGADNLDLCELVGGLNPDDPGLL